MSEGLLSSSPGLTDLLEIFLKTIDDRVEEINEDNNGVVTLPVSLARGARQT